MDATFGLTQAIKRVLVDISITIATFVIAVPHEIWAQTQDRYAAQSPSELDFASTAKNFVYVEALGSGGLFSINYDRLFSPTWAVRVGFSALSPTISNLDAGVATFTKLSLTTIPITSAYLINFPDSPHHFELGGGITILLGSLTVDVSNAGYTFTALNGAGGQLLAAYRFQPKYGGFSFRAAFTPFFVAVPGLPPIAFPWGGVSFGGTFGGF
jgi:hypothetical protein